MFLATPTRSVNLTFKNVLYLEKQFSRIFKEFFLNCAK
jgi:hypothetical protein